MPYEVSIHFEVKLDGRWCHYSDVDIIPMDIILALLGPFVKFYNVKPVAPEKGLPDDASAVTRLCHGLRSSEYKLEPVGTSWLNAEEVADFIYLVYEYTGDAGNMFGYVCNSYWQSFRDSREWFPSEIEDIRMVYWFYEED